MWSYLVLWWGQSRLHTKRMDVQVHEAGLLSSTVYLSVYSCQHEESVLTGGVTFRFRPILHLCFLTGAYPTGHVKQSLELGKKKLLYYHHFKRYLLLSGVWPKAATAQILHVLILRSGPRSPEQVDYYGPMWDLWQLLTSEMLDM